MHIVAVGCTHASELDLVIPQGDILIHTGDYTGMNSLAELPRLNKWFGQQKHAVKLLVPGNHDRVFEESPEIAKIMLSNAHVLINEEIIIQGLKFYGTPCQPAFNGWAFNEADPIKRRRIFKKIPNDTDILITHCPAYTILDDGLGDIELERRIIELKGLRYHIFSHIHGAHGIATIGQTTYANVSILDDEYNIAHNATILEVLHGAEPI